MAGNEDETLSEPIEPIEPIDFGDEPEEEEFEDRPKRASRRSRRVPGGRGGGDADESRTARRGKRDSMDRVSRYDPKKFSMRFLFAMVGALAIMGVQIGLMKEFALNEWASRGTMGWALGAGIPAGIALFCGIFGGLMAPRSYIRAFIFGAAVPAIAGIVLSVLPEGTLPVEEAVEIAAVAEVEEAAEDEAEAEGEGEAEEAPTPAPVAADAEPAPVRALLTAVNTKFLATKSVMDSLAAEVEDAAASKTDAETKAAELAGKVGELEKAKEQSDGEITKLKVDAEGEKKRADTAEQKVAGLEAKAKELGDASADLKDELKMAQKKVADGVKALADLQKKLDDATGAGGEGGVDPRMKEIEQLKLKIAQQEEVNKNLKKDLADAAAKIPSGPRKPGWMSGAEYRKLFKLSERNQQRVLKLLK